MNISDNEVESEAFEIIETEHHYPYHNTFVFCARKKYVLYFVVNKIQALLAIENDRKHKEIK